VAALMLRAVRLLRIESELDADPTAEEYVEGTLTFEGEEIGPIGVRYKGSVGAFLFCTDGPSPCMPSGAKTCTKLSLKLKINWDGSDAEFYVVKKVQLHSQNLDDTKMHERLGYWMFREMGIPAPRSTHARVVIGQQGFAATSSSVLTTSYRRMTIVDTIAQSRATIDRGLICTSSDNARVILDRHFR
jgi:spore coat protein CotH